MPNYSADVRGAEGDFVIGNNNVAKHQGTKTTVAFSMAVSTSERPRKLL
jgi:hypothetical protein